jgi:hypothetical protein
MENKRKEIFAIHWFRNCAWHGKKYSEMSMAKARAQILKWNHIKISERSGSRYMHELVKEKVLERKRRAPRKVQGKLQPQTSLTFLKEGVFKMMGHFRYLGDVYLKLADAPKVAYNLFKRRESNPPLVERWGGIDLARIRRCASGDFSSG